MYLQGCGTAALTNVVSCTTHQLDSDEYYFDHVDRGLVKLYIKFVLTSTQTFMRDSRWLLHDVEC